MGALVRGLAVLSLTITLGAVGPPVQAAVPDPNDICDAAVALIDAGRPRDAQRLAQSVAGETRPACVERAELRAQEAIDKAASHAERAGELAATDPAGAAKEVKEALKADSANPEAKELAGTLDPPTAQQDARTAWTTFRTGVLEPLGELLLPVAAVLLGAIVAARLMIMLWRSWFRSSPARRVWSAGIGTAFVVLAGVLIARGLTPLPLSESRQWPTGPTVLVTVVVLLVLGVALLAYAMGTRLRVAVEVHGEDGALDEAATGHVVTLLAELGGEHPRGIDVPRGADVSALDGTAISGLPGNAVLSLLTTMLQTGLGLTPWRLRVDTESADLLSVTVSRNGRSIAAGVVDRDALGVRTTRTDADTLPDLHPFAAAMAIVEMSKEYTGFEGLFGVTDWRSIGLTDVATRSYSLTGEKDRPARLALLTRALRLDPRNVTAAVALHHARYRESTKVADLVEYQTALVALLGRLGPRSSDDDPADPMRARIMLSYLVAEANREAAHAIAATSPVSTHAAGPPPVPTAGAAAALPDPRATAVELVALLEAMRHGSAPHRSFAEAMKPSAGSVYLSLPSEPAPVHGVTVSDPEGVDPAHGHRGSVTVQWSAPAGASGAGGTEQVWLWVAGVSRPGWQRAEAEIERTPGSVRARVDLSEVQGWPVYVAVSTAGERADADGPVRLRAPAVPIPGRTQPPSRDKPVEALAHEWTRDTSRFHPLAHYNYACRPGLPVPEAVASLRAAFSDAALKTWAAKDPALHRLRSDTHFRDLVTPATSDLVDLEPVKAHVDELRAAGAASPGALADVDPWALARHLEVDVLVGRHLRDAARLWTAIPADPHLRAAFGSRLDRLRGQVFAALLDEGVGSAADLAAHPEPEDLATKVLEAVQDACGPNVQVSDAATAPAPVRPAPRAVPANPRDDGPGGGPGGGSGGGSPAAQVGLRERFEDATATLRSRFPRRGRHRKAPDA